MNGPLVSIIVPVYNVEAYLDQCVRSIRVQTYPNLQIILVDDGSTDGSGGLCDGFAEQDSRIQVIHQENSGVSAARNTGLDAAQGTYIYFVDGDDWAAETMVADTVPVMERDGCDVCAWGMNLVQEGQEDAYSGRWTEELFQFPTEGEKQRFLCRWVLTCRVGWSVYCRAFRRDIIQRFALRFETGYAIFEDLDFFFRYLACCRNLRYIPKALYAYRQHGASVMHTSTLEKQMAGMLCVVRGQDERLSGQPLFQPFYAYAGTVLSVLLWDFTRTGTLEQGLARALQCLEASGSWEYLLGQARLAAKDRAGIRRMCGWRLGGQVNGFYRYILTRNPAACRRADRVERAFVTLRAWKNRLLHSRGGAG